MSSLRRFALPLLGVGVLALAASPVWAHCGKCAGDCKEVVKQMEAGKLSAASMIAAAEAASKGKALGMTSALEKGKMDTDVFCLVGDKVQTVPIGPDGKAGKLEENKSMSGAGDTMKAMDAGKMTLAKVAEAAAAHSKGTVLAVVASAAGGKASYEAYSMAGDKLQKVKVDDTGKATGMEEAKALPSDEKPKPKPGG